MYEHLDQAIISDTCKKLHATFFATSRGPLSHVGENAATFELAAGQKYLI